MRKVDFVVGALIIATGIVAFACNDDSKVAEKAPIMSQSDMVNRGEYLVNAIGCDDCHSPKKMGANGPEVIPELRLSGYPSGRPVEKIDTTVTNKGWMIFAPDLTMAAGPWGVSFSANITSDGTGVGNWSESNFITAIRNGKSKGLENGRSLLPPMPWYNFAKLTDDDLKSILAYLKTTNPVKNVVPQPIAPPNM